MAAAVGEGGGVGMCGVDVLEFAVKVTVRPRAARTLFI